MTQSKAVSTDWKAALKSQVAVVDSMTDTDGLPQISLKNGRMSLNDNLLPNDEIEVVILAHTFERTWYDRPYDADDKNPPDCFAIGDDQYALEPHANVPNPPNDVCKGCPMAEFGSAKQGAGPACKTRAKLLVVNAPANISAEDLLSKDLEFALYKTQPTSVVNFSGKGGLLKKLASGGLACWGAVTKIMIKPHPKKMNESTFELVRPLGDDAMMAAAFSRLPEAHEALKQAYSYEITGDKPVSETGTVDSTRY
jgi:hypothetical protein